MYSAAERFDELLRCLKDARLSDDAVHQRNSSLNERAASHDRLVMLRAEIASLRPEMGFEQMDTSGLHDSRARRGFGFGYH
jgi:hypothetical protein